MDWKAHTSGSAMFGPFISSTNGTGHLTGLASMTGYICKGVTFSEFIPDTWSEAGSGWYRVGFSTGDFNILNESTIFFDNASQFLQVWKNFNVMTATEYNAKYGTGAHQANVVQWEGATGIDENTITQWGEALLGMAKGSWRVSGSELIFLKQDEATELYRFTLGATARDNQ